MNHVQSTTRETSTNADPYLKLRSHSHATKKPSKKSSSEEVDDADDTGSTLAVRTHRSSFKLKFRLFRLRRGGKPSRCPQEKAAMVLIGVYPKLWAEWDSQGNWWPRT